MPLQPFLARHLFIFQQLQILVIIISIVGVEQVYMCIAGPALLMQRVINVVHRIFVSCIKDSECPNRANNQYILTLKMETQNILRISLANALSLSVKILVIVVLMSDQCHLQRVEVPAEVIGKFSNLKQSTPKHVS